MGIDGTVEDYVELSENEPQCYQCVSFFTFRFYISSVERFKETYPSSALKERKNEVFWPVAE